MGAGAAGAVALYGLRPANALQDALAAPAACGRLSDVEHVVIFMQENRSFDNYFGNYRGVRGFADPHVPKLPDGSGLSVLAQPGYPAPGFGGHLVPFHLDSRANGECTHDITHDWGPQHRCWNGGHMDGFVREHVAEEGVDNGALTMGYYTRSDMEFYYALADAFTLCDGYHCSVIGPTDPNQLHIASGTLDPDGKNGGPLLETLAATRTQTFGTFTWTTMPEQLEARGISWKVYAAEDNYTAVGDTPFPFFKNLVQNPALAAKAIAPRFPDDFVADAATGQLPQVSWVYASVTQSEHPPAPPILGEHATSIILSALTGNPSLWAKSALFVTWDENGGFFDHVPPVVAPPGTAGEYVTVANLPSAAEGLRGPIGLGFRVPLLILSPFSRGGFVSSDTFDHTSILRFLETRFGAEVPNLSAWRRSVTGDLTSAFNFLSAPNASVPALPAVSAADPRVIAGNCAIEPTTLGGAPLPPYPVPPNSLPGQEAGRARRPSGCGGHGSHTGSSGSGSSATQIRLTVSPTRTLRGRPHRFKFRATTRSGGRTKAVSGARVSFRGASATTNSRGRAQIVRTIRRSGNYLARATKGRLRTGRAVVRIRRRLRAR
jgi:phospholipase C